MTLTHLLLRPCRTPDELHRWIRLFLGLDVPRRCVCDNHDAPFDYLCRAYFEPAEDLIVWAPRGGGKTRLAAVATLLDLLHKPGVQARILGGSLEQSLRMWEHLLPDVRRLAGRDLLDRRSPASRRIRLRNRSAAAVLTQSERAVRGLRVQKLRCDEVELFDPRVWEAAQLVTRSRRSAVGGRQEEAPLPTAADGRPPAADCVRGTIEALSTFHRPFGLMQRLTDAAGRDGAPRVIRWCLMEVLERCPPERDCRTCPLWDDCRGVAKARCDGFVSIDDAVALKRRVSAEAWAAEMLCRRPSTRGAVFPTFDPAAHVAECAWPHQQPATSNSQRATSNPQLCLAIDFGFANPFVCLWIVHDGRRVHVIDEYVQPQRTLVEHLSYIQQKGYGTVAWVACDPAGGARSEQTGDSPVNLLRRAGFSVRCRRSRVLDGLEEIRVALRPAAAAAGGEDDGAAGPALAGFRPGMSRHPTPPPPAPPRLLVHPRCVRLIRALQCYRYADPSVDAVSATSELPLKDGEHDHLVDALRYFFINRRRGTLLVSSY